ncbi:peptidoglycan-binding protein [Paramyrothecium foliicola]|nr:peptidoglycan-binding protein [Paramyrothecium foliicola]
MKFTAFASIATILALQASTAAAATCNISGKIHMYSGYVLLTPRYERSDGSSITDCTLRENNSGAGVKALQIAHNKCYTNKDTPRLDEDGKFGPKTETALREMQRYEGGLTVDGVYGPKTSKRLRFYVRNENNGRQFCARMDPPYPDFPI